MSTPYDPASPDWSAIRRIFLDWLRSPGRASQFPADGQVYDAFVEYANGNRRPDVLAFHTWEVFWQLLAEGVVAPGSNSMNVNLPHFHVTQYGEKILASEEGHPHDEASYLARVHARIPNADPTVIAYLTEAVTTFRRGTPVASTVMLGIAAERVFLMVCDALRNALRDPSERAAFDRILQKFAMKPKLDWVHAKLSALQSRRSPGLPENATLMVTAIYDFLRNQRNELGHPRDLPPNVDREDAFTNFQVFPRYYQVAEELRRFLATNQV